MAVQAANAIGRLRVTDLMARNYIVTEQTLRTLLEAHASLSAWYFGLSAALRASGGVAKAPSDAERAAFIYRIAAEFPELAALALEIGIPRVFVPAPPGAALANGSEEHATLTEPAPARYREATSAPPSSAAVPPPIVDPTKVRY